MAIGNPISSQNNYRVIRFTAAASQTLFTITDGYAINKIAVYRNGVRLSENLDFTASDATTVTLNDPCQLNDEVVFEILDTFKVAQVGDITGNVTGNLTGDVYAGIVTATIRFDGDLAGSVNGGIVTCTELDVNGNADISGNVTIGGTLTYDDVTNVDSLGIVTAREGVHFGTVSDGTLVVGNSTGIGIGTTNPTAKLDVDGTLNVTGVSTFAGITTVTGSTLFSKQLNVSGISTFDDKVALGSSVYDSNGGTGTDGQVLSSVPGIGVSWTDQTGGGASDKIEENNTSAEVVDTGSDGHFKVVTDGAEKLRVISDGSVGIGTTTPIAKLDVQGSSEFDSLKASGIVTFSGPRIETKSHTRFYVGDANAQLYRQSSDLLLDLSGNNDILIKANASGGSAGNISLRTIEGGKVYLTGTGGVGLYHSDATLKLETTYSGVDVTGVLTATKFSGDGSELTGLTGVSAGIDIKDSDSAIGIAGTINFGTNLSVTPVSLGIVTVTASGGASGVATGVTLVQSDSPNAFHYLNFTERLTGDEPIRTDSQLRWQPNSQELNLGSGNITLATITSDIFTSSTVGTDGVTIADDIKSVRHINSTGVVTATSYEVYSATPEILFNDHNGGIQTDFAIKVNQGNFTIEDVTSSETVFKYSALGEGVELYCDNAKKLATTGSGVSVTGVVTATKFSGDGSELTGLTGVSAGIDIKDNDSAIGIAGTINFGTNLSVTPVSLGIVTVTASSVGGASSINDLSDAKTYGAGGKGIGIGSFALYSISNNVRDNTAIGYSALTNCTAGQDNVAVGEDALRGKNGETFYGNENVAVGEKALANVRAGAEHNVAIGAKALTALELGDKNVAIGRLAGQALVTSLNSENNVYIGDAAGIVQTAGKFSVFVGPGAGRTVTTGTKNVLIGRYAGGNLTVGTNNICIGDESSTSAATANNELTLGGPGITSFRIPGLQSGASNGDVLTYNSSTGYISLQAASGGGGGSGASEINDLSDGVTNSGGRTVGLGTGALANDDGTTNDNTALGYYALNANTSGNGNTGIGNSALAKCVDGGSNTAVGEYALNSLTTGDDNTAVGYNALTNNQTALRCTAMGYFALENCTGNNNTGLGVYAGDGITNGTNNTCIGFHAEASSATVSNEITLGNTDVTRFRIPGIGITFGDNTSLTDGHVLTYSSSTGEVKLAAVSGGVANAAGSDGQVQYNNGGTSLGGASALYYDDTNNRVGIDTTIPAYELQVGNIGVNPDVTAVAISTALFSYHLGIGHTQLSRASAKPYYSEHGAVLTLGAPSGKTAYIIIDANRSTSADWGSVAIGDYENLRVGGATNNVAIGGKNLYSCQASYNVAIGDQNLENISTVSTHNIGIGYQTLANVTSDSSFNIALGYRAGRGTGTNLENNIFIGRNAGNLVLESNSNNNIFIGKDSGSDGTATQRDRNIIIGNVPAAKVGDDQFAIGVDNGSSDNYWLVGDENKNIGIGTTNPTASVGVGNTAVLAVGIVSAYQVYVNGSPISGGGGGISNVVEDTTPQLGGDLNTNSSVIEFPDSSGEMVNRAHFGDHRDLQIYHDGNNSFISDTGTGNLVLGGGGHIELQNANLNEYYARFISNGGSEFYFNNSKKFETQGMGVTVTGRTSTNTLDVTGISTFQDDITVATETLVAFGNTSLDRHDANLKLYQSGLFEIKNGNNEGGAGSGVINIQSNTNEVRLTAISSQVILRSNGVNERLRTENAGVKITGFCTVTGAISKGSGSFRIDHPVIGMSTTHDLVHSFIEGPQADLIYRGSVDLVSGIGTVNIDTAARMTEGTFDALCTNVQCFTSNETDWTAVKGSVSGNILTITAQDSSSTATVGWMVVGERKDQHMLDTHWTDDDGRVIVEPTK